MKGIKIDISGLHLYISVRAENDSVFYIDTNMGFKTKEELSEYLKKWITKKLQIKEIKK